MNRGILESGFLAFNSAEDLQTLVALSFFADRKRRCRVSSRELARSLNLPQKQASERIERILRIRWQSRPLVVRESEGSYYLLPSKEFSLSKEEGETKEGRLVKEKARRRADKEKVRKIKKEMSQKRKEKLKKIAEENINRITKGAFGKNIPKAVLDGEINRIIQREYLDKNCQD